MMRLGVANEETWDFFDEIYSDLNGHYQTSLFKRRTTRLPFFYSRINRYLFKHNMQIFLKSQDVVFFEWASELLTAATKLPKVCGIVTRLHRYEMYEWVDRVNWSHVDKVILVSNAKQQEFINKFPEQASKTVVIAPSTSLARFQSHPKTFSGDIGILCHLTPRKRVYELILAFYELNPKKHNLHLRIAGGRDPAFGDYFAALHYIVNKLDLQNNVTFYGNVRDTWNWYTKIDIFISNSYSEGLQVAPMEAMASGCYCLSHYWDGANELLPDANLYYTDRELQMKILQYIDLPDSEKQNLRIQMREMACDKFDIEQTKTQIRQVINQVAESRLSTL
jgi:glycosyltransferase involved in cell wall biosynthesis